MFSEIVLILVGDRFFVSCLLRFRGGIVRQGFIAIAVIDFCN